MSIQAKEDRSYSPKPTAIKDVAKGFQSLTNSPRDLSGSNMMPGAQTPVPGYMNTVTYPGKVNRYKTPCQRMVQKNLQMMLHY